MMRPDDARAIRDDIEQTRARMGDAVEALGARLNPERVKQQVKDNIREATIGRVQTMANNAKNRVEEGGRGLVATVRENPIPAALIVGGLGWLLFARKRGGAEVPATHKVAGAATSSAHRVADAASSSAHRVADGARAQSRRIAGSFESNPLALGALVAGVGLAVGMSLPATEREARLMGVAREEGLA